VELGSPNSMEQVAFPATTSLNIFVCDAAEHEKEGLCQAERPSVREVAHGLNV